MKLNNTINKFYIFLGCIGVIILFRIIPHPPNFTPVIALSFYLPVFFGLWCIPIIILAFAITDFFIGFHSLLIWTWGSLAIIGIISKYGKSFFSRFGTCIIGSWLFFIISNFGVWLTGSFYEISFKGLTTCYIMAIPFFTNTLFSTIIFAIFIEFFVFSKQFNFLSVLKNKID
jgi:hypothetical protein